MIEARYFTAKVETKEVTDLDYNSDRELLRCILCFVLFSQQKTKAKISLFLKEWDARKLISHIR